ncbi:hypothetical protein [uncultured Microscilla sp.]|uniref:hypothetical protein n=1 Tax=uncultured Microscilla sp. TaxID=432653 RepID=UPI00261DC360|nr:hypothetical protein [uncultured Microscilla sp.]
MTDKNIWLQNFKHELDKTREEYVNTEWADALSLETAELVAKKLLKHSKKCAECEKMQDLFLEYIIELRYIEFDSSLNRSKSELKALRAKKRDKVHDHLKTVHHYKGTMDNRISLVFIALFLTIVLPIADSVIAFGWHWLLSFPTITIAWLIGYTLDKRNIKKGWAI